MREGYHKTQQVVDYTGEHNALTVERTVCLSVFAELKDTRIWI